MPNFLNTVDLIGDEALTDRLIYRSISEIRDNQIETIGVSAFSACPDLATVELLAAKKIGRTAFSFCNSLVSVSLPAATDLGEYAFENNPALAKVYLPVAQSAANYLCRNCGALTLVDFGFAPRVGIDAFRDCSALQTLVLRSNTMVTRGNGNALVGVPKTCCFYVPSSLVDSYKASSAWSEFNQFRALEDYTVDGTTTGALDESKI